METNSVVGDILQATANDVDSSAVVEENSWTSYMISVLVHFLLLIFVFVLKWQYDRKRFRYPIGTKNGRIFSVERENLLVLSKENPTVCSYVDETGRFILLDDLKSIKEIFIDHRRCFETGDDEKIFECLQLAFKNYFKQITSLNYLEHIVEEQLKDFNDLKQFSIQFMLRFVFETIDDQKFEILENLFRTNPTNEDQIKAILQQIVAEQQQQQQQQQKDFFNSILKIEKCQEDEQRARLVFFVIRHGFQLIHRSLTAIASHLVQYPEDAELCRTEVDHQLKQFNFDRRHNLVNIRAFIKETLRLAPVESSTVRKSLENIRWHEYNIKRGTKFVANILGIHYSNHWQDAEKFDMARWVPENQGNIPTFAYFPFGFNLRRCLDEENVFDLFILIVSRLISNERFLDIQ